MNISRIIFRNHIQHKFYQLQKHLRFGMAGNKTIFDKIISLEIPSQIVWEDDKTLAFKDINPQAPVHVVLIPKVRDGLTQLSKAEEKNKEILGHLLWAASQVADKMQLKKGWRLVINDGEHGCQSVYHIHLHILGGCQLGWPPGTPGGISSKF